MKLNELTDGQTVTYRIGRYASGKSSPDFGKWTQGTIYVMRRIEDLPKRYRRGSDTTWQAGSLLAVTIRNVACAEFSQDDWSEECRTFCCEDWYLEIEGLE